MGRVTFMAFLGLKPEGKYCFVHRGGLALLCSDRPTSDLRNFSFKICVRKKQVESEGYFLPKN